MSTRSVITVSDDDNTFHIYKHCDGYPTGASEALENALAYAWELPRFEAMDWAAAFIAGNKTKGRGGNIYCTKGPKFHGDLEYRYEVTFKESPKKSKSSFYPEGALHIKAFAVSGYEGPQKSTKLFEGTLAEFHAWADENKATHG